MGSLSFIGQILCIHSKDNQSPYYTGHVKYMLC